MNNMNDGKADPEFENFLKHQSEKYGIDYD